MLDVNINTAIVSMIDDPIFCYDNALNQLMGGVTLANFTHYFHQALENDAIKNIILHIDSPGGTVSSINETAEIIYHAHKRIVSWLMCYPALVIIFFIILPALTCYFILITLDCSFFF